MVSFQLHRYTTRVHCVLARLLKLEVLRNLLAVEPSSRFVRMCDPSVVAEDWITKGFHFLVAEVELALRPDHAGFVVFRQVFSSTPPEQVKTAIRSASKICITDPFVRAKWLQQIDHAMLLVSDYVGALRERANGRLAEFHFLKIALRRY